MRLVLLGRREVGSARAKSESMADRKTMEVFKMANAVNVNFRMDSDLND